MLRFAGIQMLVNADKNVNLKKAADFVAKAAKAGAHLISLPECFNCPYGNNFFEKYAENIPNGPTTKYLEDLAREHKIFLIGGSIPEECNGTLFNTCLVFNPDGKIVAKHRKVHLFDIDIPGKIRFQESETLSCGNDVTVFDANEFKIGIGICYDVRFPELAHLMRQQGAHVLVYPGAFNMTTGPIYYELLNRSRAVDNQVYCASIAPALDESASYHSWGHSVISSPSGQIMDAVEHEEGIVYCDIEMNVIKSIRESIPTWNQKRNDIYQVVKVDNSDVK